MSQKTKGQSICLWSGYNFFVLYVFGFVFVSGFIPPHSPSLSGDEISAIFEANRWKILIGQSICVVASALFVPWTVSIFGQMLRIESREVTRFPALSVTQLIAGGVGGLFFMIPSMIWIAIAFRSDHDSGSILLLNDLAWFLWFISTPLFIIQELAVGLCGLMYKNNVFKRWFSYYCIWTPVTLVPVCFVALFKTGPFAWDGLFGFYIPIALYIGWFHLATFSVYNGIKQESELLSS